MKKFRRAVVKPKLFPFKSSFSKELNELHSWQALKDRPDRAVALKRLLCVFGLCIVNKNDLEELEKQKAELERKLYIVATEPKSDEANMIVIALRLDKQITEIGMYGDSKNNKLTGLKAKNT